MKTAKQVMAGLDAARVSRFHCHYLLRPQHVDAHSWQVALLCYALSGGAPSVNLLLAALTHDLGERWTGDVPGPVKAATQELKEFLDALESSAVAENLDLPRFMLTLEERAILKAADRLSGMYHCLVERRLGNATLRTPFLNYASWLASVEHLLAESELATELRVNMELEYDKF